MADRQFWPPRSSGFEMLCITIVFRCMMQRSYSVKRIRCEKNCLATAFDQAITCVSACIYSFPIINRFKNKSDPDHVFLDNGSCNYLFFSRIDYFVVFFLLFFSSRFQEYLREF